MTSRTTWPRSIDLLDLRLHAQCDAILSAAKVPGASVAIVVGDKGYHHARGIKSIITGAPVTADTGFNIGSCSKAFASAAVASLVAEGLVRWDDPISTWVPEFQLHDPKLTELVTLRDLGANRLGLPRAGLGDFGLDPRFPAENLFARLKHTPSAFPFRDRFGYLNAGHAANSVAAGRITGKGYLATLRERILAPLRMNGTSGGEATPHELTDLAGWHVVVGGEVVAIDPVFTDQYLSSGGMVVSGRDALQWLRLHLNGGLVDGKQIIPREALLETHRPHALARPGTLSGCLYPGARMGAYGLGWGVSDLEGQSLIAHSGSDLGVTAMTLLLPDAGIGVAVYANINGRAPGAQALAYALAATLLGLKPRDWLAYFDAFTPPPPAPAASPDTAAHPADLALYAGCYEHPADGAFDVRIEGERLLCNVRDAYRMEAVLLPFGEHRFRMALIAPEWKGGPGAESLTVSFSVEAGVARQANLPAQFAGRPFIRRMP